MSLTFKAPAKIFKNHEFLKQALFWEDGNQDWVKSPMNIDDGVLFKRGNKSAIIKLYKGESPKKNKEGPKPITKEPERVPSDLRRPEVDIDPLKKLKDKAQELQEEIRKLKEDQAKNIKEEAELTKAYKNHKQEYKKKLHEQEVMERKEKSIVKYINKELKKKCDSRIQSIRNSLHIHNTPK